MLQALPSSWQWLALPGDPPLGLPLPPGQLGRAWAERLRHWNQAGRPWPADPAQTCVLRRSLTALLEERYLGSARSLATRVPLSSRIIPAGLRLRLHRLMARPAPMDGPGPHWPADDSADQLRDLLGPAGPAGFRWALSHDLDTPASYPVARRLARRQAELGHRATYFVVGRDLPRAGRLVDELRGLGHEVGLHGLLHDFRLGHLRGGALARRTDRLASLARAHGIAGFRSPALLSSPGLRRRLAATFRYDSSLPTSDRQTLVGPVRGCATSEPYPLDGLTEVPISAPLEDRLMLLGYGPRQIFDLYAELRQRARDRRRLLVLAYHLEPHLGGRPEMLEALDEFLGQTADHPARCIAACLEPR